MDVLEAGHGIYQQLYQLPPVSLMPLAVEDNSVFSAMNDIYYAHPSAELCVPWLQQLETLVLQSSKTTRHQFLLVWRVA